MAVNDLQAGARSAAVSRFERLYREQAPAVLAYVARRVPADSVADVVADTFAVVWRRLDRVPDDPFPWLLGIARRVIANQRRSHKRREALVEKSAAQPVFDNRSEPAGALREVLAALSELPEKDREVLQLAVWEGLSAKEAGRVLGCSATAYRLRLHRARLKLAERLDPPEPAEQRDRFRPTLRPEELP